MEKPPVLSKEQLEEVMLKFLSKAKPEEIVALGRGHIGTIQGLALQAQRDADVEWYKNHSDEANDAEQGAIEVLDELGRIQQARQDTAREIFEAVNRLIDHTESGSDNEWVVIDEDNLQSLKSKYLIPPNPVGNAEL